jgi:hypothetical protein
LLHGASRVIFVPGGEWGVAGAAGLVGKVDATARHTADICSTIIVR